MKNSNKSFYSYDNIAKKNSKIHLVDKTHYELLNPICPKCDSILTSKQEWREINPVLPVISKVKIWIKRYKCKKCNKKFQTNLQNFLNRFDTISHVIKDNIIETAKKGNQSLRKMAENLKIHSNIDISHQTIKNITDIDVVDEIKNRIPVYSDIMLMMSRLLEQKEVESTDYCYTLYF
jgi:transposase-like protein